MPTRGDYIKQLPPPKKILPIENCLRKRGFGLFRFEEKPLNPMRNKAKEYAEKIIRDLDTYVKEFNSAEDKSNFLYDLQYYLGAIIAGTMGAIGDCHNPKPIPKEFTIDLPIFDHFAKRDGKWVCNPYGTNSGELEALAKWCHERGLRFNVSANSNYFPFHTLEVRFTRD